MSTGSTANYNLSFPLSTDPVNVSGDIQSLATILDTFLTNPAFINGISLGNATLSTAALTANVFNTNATTLNIGQSATALSMGATTGTATLRNPTIVSAAASLTLFNQTSTTINFGAAATTFNIGASTGAATMNISNGATTNATTKTVNVGGSGVSGSTTNINIGSAVSGALGTTTINSANVSILSSAISLGTVTAGTWSGTAIAANRGGTGLTSYVIGDIVFASGATTLARLAGVATGNALISGGIGAAPSFGKVGLTTHVSGTLPVANGGTGVTTSTGTGNVVLSASPTFTGVPASTTAALGTNTTQIATTAFVINQINTIPSPTKVDVVEIGWDGSKPTRESFILSDAGKAVEVNIPSPASISIEPESATNFPIGSTFDIIQTGAGNVTIGAIGAVIINAKDGLVTLTKQYSAATIYKKSSNTWILIGDLG